MSTTSRNIILILTDQHRFDIVGANGSRVCQSPSLDRLAADGVNFTNAYSVCGVCTPARASIYTGLLPHRHGLTRNVMDNAPNPGSIPASVPTLAQRLGDAGYESHFIGKWHAGERLPTQAGFSGMDLSGYGDARGDADYRDYLHERGLELPSILPLGYGWSHRLTLAGVTSGPVEASVPSWLTERAVEFLAGRGGTDDPFFLAVNFWGPHAPYLPSEPYASMYDPADIAPWANFGDAFEGKPPIYRRCRDAFIGEGNPPRSWEECAQWAALYFGFATQIDAQIGRLLDALRRHGLEDNTAVLFSCDHGDFTGCHGGMHDKGGIMSQEIYHIPLICRIPGTPAGAVRDAPVNNMDLPKTILSLAGVAADGLDGHDLYPLIEQGDDPDRPDYTVSECFGHHFAYETRMVIHDRFKYVFHPAATDELYDLRNDPWETTNLARRPDFHPVLTGCRERLIDWAKGTGDELCVLCGLFHERAQQPAQYGASAMDALRHSPTRLLTHQTEQRR